MAGVIHDPLSDVQLIADNLRDRYKSGFPVLKEIIQNSDDARANQLILGWCDGLAGAEHPLLGDPAVFFINNAPLALDDIKGIMSIALGAKAGNKTAVGKFGLGMKSLFHLGELFFFMGSGWRDVPDRANVFNPWAVYRQHWDSFSQQDKVLMETSLKKLTDTLSGEDSFIVWVPLRSHSIMSARGDDDAVIVKSNDYKRSLPDFLTAPDLPEQLGKLFPLLKWLKNVQAYTLQAGQAKQNFSVMLKDDAGRIAYGRGLKDQEWKGKIVTEHHDSKQKAICIDYAGAEVLLDSPSFTELKSHPLWPNSYGRGKGHSEVQIPDKAEPHAAAVLLRKPCAQKAVLTIHWAVFLPLGEQDISQSKQSYQVPLEGEFSYDMLLHGYFFIDAGRVGIHGQREIGSLIAAEIKAEEDLTLEWNRQLANTGTLGCLLPAFALLVKNFRLSSNETESIARGLHNFLNQRQEQPNLLPLITQNHHWAFCITPEERGWQLISAEQAVRLIPAPVSQASSADDYRRIWETLPGLSLLAESVTFVEESRPNLLSRNDSQWSKPDLECVLNINLVEVFSSQKNLAYLNSFIRSVFFHVSDLKDELQPRLTKLVKKALSDLSLRKLSANKQQVQAFIQLISPWKRCPVRVDKNVQSVWDAINASSEDVLIIPDFLEPESEKSTGTLTIDDTIRLLNALSKVTGDLTEIQNDIEQVVLELTSKLSLINQKEIYQRCSNLKLFKARAVDKKRDTLVSRSQLSDLFQKRQLFCYSGPRDIGLGASLRKAINSGSELLFINDKINKVLFDGRVPKCDSESVLNLLLLKPLLKEVTEREQLLSQISSHEVQTTEQRLAFRYLLHGQPSANDVNVKLWVSSRDHDVWGRIWQQAASTIDQVWTVIPNQLSRHLASKHKDALNIHEINPSSVLEELGEQIVHLDYSQIIDNRQDYAEEILTQIIDEELWKAVPLHLATDGSWVSVTPNCVLEGGEQLPGDLESKVVRIRHAYDGEVLNKQKRLIGELNDFKALSLALQQQSPSEFASFILQRLIPNAELIEEEFLSLLREAKWLSVGGRAVSPQQVMDLDSAEFPQANKLCQQNVDCYLISQLDELYLSNYALVKQFVVTPELAPQLLFEQAVNLPVYALGECQEITERALRQACSYSDLFVELPGWLLVLECYEASDQTAIVSKWTQILCQRQIDIDALVRVHQHLSQGQEPDTVRDIRTCLLWAICSEEAPTLFLKKLRLRACDNLFHPAEKLAVDVTNIAPRFLLHKDEWGVLSAVLNEIRQEDPEKRESSIAKPDDLELSADVLRDYFRNWEQYAPKECIAPVLALMSGDNRIAKLAESLLGQRSLIGLLEQIGQLWKVLPRDNNNPPLFPEQTLTEAVNKMRFSVEKCLEDEITVRSIFGDTFQAELNQEPTTIFIWESYNFKHSLQVGIRLCPIDLPAMGEDQLSSILKASAELLLIKIYGQRIMLNDLWSDLNQVEQLDITVAKEMILEGVIYHLKSLKINQPPIGELLHDFRTELQKEKEAQHNNIVYSSQRSRILDEICRCVEKDQKLQDTLLLSMRSKVEEYQYRPESVPFELFQNADDAVAELIELDDEKHNPDEIPARFVVNSEQNSISCFHWGRDVNQYRTFDGSFDGKKRGFDADLEKMLTLNVSDKGRETTGKFGLGFKSCLLICDQPDICSGRLAVRVNAGMLPIVSPNHDWLKEQVNSRRIERRSPTMIHLPLRREIEVEDVLKEFRLVAGVLPILAKKLRTVVINNDEYNWLPTKCEKIRGLSFGYAALPTQDGKMRKQRVAHYRSDNGQFVFQVSGKGFTSLLERKLPKLWVLNPLWETIPLGFILESDFQVDVGRSQLARNSQKNVEQMQKLGRDLAVFLREVYQWTTCDWEGFVNAFELDCSTDFDSFWKSVWRVLSDGWSQKSISVDDSGLKDSGSELVRQLFTAEAALLDFYKETPVLPVMLSGVFPSLTKLDSVRHYADPLLSRLIKSLIYLPEIEQMTEKGLLVSDEVGDLLKKTGHALNMGISQLSLELIVDLLAPDKYVSPKQASVLGQVFTKKFERLLVEQKATQQQAERFRKRLGSLCFKSAGNSLSNADRLLVDDGQDTEESLKARFAPHVALLSTQYHGDGLVFCRFCRDRLQFGGRDMLEWAKSKELSENPDRQEALCRYLVDGEAGDDLALKIRNERYSFPWLHKLDAAVLQNWGWNNNDIDKLLNFQFASDEVKSRRVDEELKRNWQAQLSVGEVLSRIHQWWQEEGSDYLKTYEKRLYPEGRFAWMAIKNEDDSLLTRKAWLQLLYLGSCQTLGRTREAQHRSALLWFEQKGWWDIFADPELESGQWFQVMDEFLEHAVVNEQYRNWLQILPLYRFARNLDEYIELFWGAEEYLEDLDDLLRPGSCEKLTGCGIWVPELRSTLGIGANFILRELIRNGVMEASVLAQHCFVSSYAVRRLMSKLGCRVKEESASGEDSAVIYQFIADELGEDMATFDDSFDIPLRIVSEDQKLREKLLGIGQWTIDGEVQQEEELWVL